MIATNYKPKIQKTVLNPTAPVARVRNVMFIDFPHQIQIPFRYRPRRVITAGARQSEQKALAAHRQRVLPLDHRLALAPSIRPSADSKKSFSIVSYERVFEGQRLKDDEFVLSTDEKTSIQARARRHPTLPPKPGQPMRVEHEYRQCGAWAYIAALDVHRAKIFGRCERKTGIIPFDRLVAQVMTRPPYSEARRVFWIMDNGSSHRGAACVKRLVEKYPRIVPVHGPIHASWLNQIEIYFSIIQRKVLTPNDFPSLEALKERLFAFERHYEAIAKPFEWKFTRQDLSRLLRKMNFAPVVSRAAA